jgi:hypothetical protein
MKKKTSLWLWLLALAMTLLLAVYQRLSGPTYPIKGKQTISGIEIRYKFYRSWTSQRFLPVRLAVTASGLHARLFYRRFPFSAGEDWTVQVMENRNGVFAGDVPGQPAAGKVAYKVEVRVNGKSVWLNRGHTLVARFKGEFPAPLLIVHILFMFAGLLLAFRTGLEALRRAGRWQKLVPWTLAVTAVGGLLMGPLVQKFAFNSYWTGFPLGSDLTDSKTLLAVLFWLAAYLLRKKSRWWTVTATVLMVAVYLIPHSIMGSELDYKTGEIGTATEIQH